jgi:hypothetical protein
MNHTLRQHNALLRTARALAPPPAARPPQKPGLPELAALARTAAAMLCTRGVSRVEVKEVLVGQPVVIVIAWHPGLDRLAADWASTGRDGEGRYDWYEIELDEVALRWRRPSPGPGR